MHSKMLLIYKSIFATERSFKSMRKVLITVVILFFVILLAGALLSYPEKEDRVIKSYLYESKADKEKVVSQNQIVLSVTDAEQRLSADTDDAVDYDSVQLKKDDSLKWEFEVSETGSYVIGAGYFPLEGKGQEFSFLMQLDDRHVSTEEANVTLTRLWTDSGVFLLTSSGDEIRPGQKEQQMWTEEKFKLNSEGDIVLYLTEGLHVLTLTGVKEECLLSYIRIYQDELKSYEEYLNETKAAPVHISKEVLYKEQAETPYLRSSSLLYAMYDRSSSLTTPYDAAAIRYNTIGGDNWNKEGQWIEWAFEVEEDGYYQIGLRFRQNQNKGVTSSRRIYIDGTSPFEELKQVEFPYKVAWQTDYLGYDEPFWFYLTKGEHLIRMEVELGDLKDVTLKMSETIQDLNALYREIIILTGTEPDIYRDYHLETAIPDLLGKLAMLTDDLTGYEEFIESLYGANSYASRILSQLKRQIESFEEKPYTIQKRLGMFRTNISAFAEWVFEFIEQPLEVDCLYVTGIGSELPKAEANFFGKAGHELHAFIGSFFHDYGDVSGNSEGEETTEIRVWIGKGRDQASVIKRLVDEYFTPQTGIRVEISLVEGALVKASIAGQGPDVNLFTSRGEAMNLAFRGALLPLTDRTGFADMKEEYMESAFVPYTYKNTVYAIPEEQNFYMMFIRTDVFQDLGIDIPATWDDLMEIMPHLQSANLSIGLPYVDGYAVMNSGIGTINLLPTLLAQQGISIYSEDFEKTNLVNKDAYKMFKMWTDFYSMYNFPLYKDDFNRFRTGEMPVAIASYNMYNTLTKAAPEISGQWIMTSVPGTKSVTGELNIATSASGTCNIILKDTEYEDAAWEFLKWWNDAETQTMYSKDIESELSIIGRYTPANLSAFKNTNWYDEEKEILLKSLETVVEIPEVPGGYYVSRNIDNAFRDVYYNGENVRESLYYWMNAVDEELSRKQNQIKKRVEGEE